MRSKNPSNLISLSICTTIVRRTDFFPKERKTFLRKELEGTAAATQSQHSYKYENRYTIYEVPLYQNCDATHT